MFSMFWNVGQIRVQPQLVNWDIIFSGSRSPFKGMSFPVPTAAQESQGAGWLTEQMIICAISNIWRRFALSFHYFTVSLLALLDHNVLLNQLWVMTVNVASILTQLPSTPSEQYFQLHACPAHTKAATTSNGLVCLAIQACYPLNLLTLNCIQIKFLDTS